MSSEQDFSSNLIRLPGTHVLRPDDPTTVLESSGEATQTLTVVHAQTEGVVTVKNFLQHPDTHPVVLDLVLIKKYGTDWLTWAPETFYVVLPRDFTTTVSDLNITKLQAMKTMHLVDTFWQQWEVFNWLCAAVNATFPDFELMQVPTVAQCMVAVDIASRVRADVPWTREVQDFISVVHRHDGILVPQAPLEFVKVDTTGMPIDVEEISSKWPEVRASGKAPEDDTVTGEQLRRMLVAHGFLEESRTRLQQQLPLVPHV
jgi:hypothetical protein